MWVILSREKGRGPYTWLPAHYIHYSTSEQSQYTQDDYPDVQGMVLILKLQIRFS